MSRQITQASAQLLLLILLFSALVLVFDHGLERQADWMAENYGSSGGEGE